MEIPKGSEYGPLRTVAAFLVHSNLFISTAATGVALSTITLAGLTPELLPLFIVFAATLFVYSLNRLTDLEEDMQNVPRRATFTHRYGRSFFIIGVLLYLGSIGGAFVLGITGAPFLLLPIVAAVLYSLFRVKQYLLIKNLIVGVSWGLIPLGVGFYYGVIRSPEILVSFGFFTIMLTVAAAVFDIKDIEGDKTEDIRTIPIVFGTRKTRIGAAAVTVIVGAVMFGFITTGVVPRQFAVFFGFLGYVLAYIPFATEDRGSLFYGFVIDGEHIFLTILVLVMELM